MMGPKFAVLAQLVERSIRNAKVRSSILRDGSYDLVYILCTIKSPELRPEAQC